MRAEQIAQKLAPRYDRTCRKLSDEEIKKNLQANKPYTIRLKINYSQGSYEVQDLLRGEVSFKAAQLDEHDIDEIYGFPTYHLASV